MIQTTVKRSPALRAGVSVIEVLFATGIAVTGLLGVFSLLGMAGRNASQANQALESQTLAADWYSEFTARGINRSENWMWYQDYSGGGLGASGTKPFDKQAHPLTQSIGQRGTMYERPQGKVSVCLDPSFFSDRSIRANLGGFDIDLSSGPTGTETWYRPAVFPYYQDGFNPLTDSGYRITSTTGLAWADQPRMLRASLRVPTTGTVGAPQVLSEKQVMSMFASNNELVTLASEEDKALPAERGYQFMPATGSTSVVAKGAHNARYSWIATLSPREDINSPVPPVGYPLSPRHGLKTASTENYTLSLVVIFQRDRSFVDLSQFSERTNPLPSSEGKPAGERLTWVVPQSGNFTGGSGGRVRLIASGGTSDELSVGDWIMLSRHVGSNATTPNVEAYSVFRWYRIVYADPKPSLGLVADFSPTGVGPFGNALTDSVWARDVVLDGPDWQFTVSGATSMVPGMSPGVGIAPTSGTLVKGVVAVHERVVTVPPNGDF